jgi:pimeloyl-ACP methyl ester carboxylesterase
MAAARPATEFATSADGTRIAFDREGSGPLLVLVDGALVSRAMGPSRALQEALRDRFTVVAFDRRGRGESGDAPEGRLDDAPEREIEDLRAVIDAVGGDAVVLGQSSGAALAYRAAAAGVPMRRLVGFEAPWLGMKPGEDYLATLDDLIARDERGKAVSYFLVTMVSAPAFVPVMLRVMRTPWKAMTGIAPTLRYDARVMGGDFALPAAELGRIGIPTLVLVGGKSPAPMTRAQDAVAAAIPGARHEVIPGQNHQVSAAALAPVAAAFLGE